jgi:hypothetical protein
VTQTIHEEYAVLDRAGRMQLPKDYRDSLELKDRVRLELEDDHIGVWNDQAPRVPKPAPAVSEPEAEGEAESDAASTADDPAAQSTDSPAEPVHDDERFAPPAASAATAAVTAADAWSHSRPVITPPTRDNESAPVSPAPASAAPSSAGEQAPTPADDAGGKRVRFEPAPERPSPQVQSMLEPGAAAYEPYMQGLDDESTPYQPRIEPREPEETPNQSVSPATAPVDPAPNASSEPDAPSDPVASPDPVAPSPPVTPSPRRPPAASPPGRPVSPYLPTEPAAGNEGALPPSRRERREALEAEGESPDGARPPRAATDPATPAHDPDTPVDQPRRPAPRSPWLPVKEDDDE